MQETIPATPGMNSRKVNPKKFGLWVFIVAVIMLFAGLTSAYIVRMAEGNWFDFNLPAVFNFSTLALLLSSATMRLALFSAKKDLQNRLRLSLFTTFVLGGCFLAFQWMGWMDLIGRGIFFAGPEGSRVSASFLYVITGFHMLHIAGGLAFLLYTILNTMRLSPSQNYLSIDLCDTYWHFLGVLWIYLYLFLYFAPNFIG